MTATHDNDGGRRGTAWRTMRGIWRRRKWLIIFAFLLPFAAAISFILTMPDLYRAKTTVLITHGQFAEIAPGITAGGDVEARLQAISEEILSRGRLQRLIHRFDLYPELRRSASPDAVIDRMRRDIRLERKEVESRWGRNVTVAFTLTYQGWDPQTVAMVANTLASFYVEENERHRPYLTPSSRSTPGAISAPGSDALTRLRQELAQLRTQYSDRYPDIVRLKAEIEALERQRDDMRTTRTEVPVRRTPPAELDAMRRELDDLEIKEQQLSTAIAAAQRYNETAPQFSEEVVAQRNDELNQYRRDYEATKAKRASLRKRYEEALRVERSKPDSGDQFQVIDTALPPAEAAAPNRPRLMLMAFILSLGLAGIAALLAEQFDTSFHRLDELWAHTQIPILAGIPRIVTRGDVWRRRLRVGFTGVVAVFGLGLVVYAAFVVGHAGESLVWMLAQRGT